MSCRRDRSPVFNDLREAVGPTRPGREFDADAVSADPAGWARPFKFNEPVVIDTAGPLFRPYKTEVYRKDRSLSNRCDSRVNE